MKVDRQTDHLVSEEAATAATGKSMQQWFSMIDERGGLALGRREIGQWLMVENKVDPWWTSTLNHEYEIARGALEKDGNPKGYTVCATKTLQATPDQVYAYFSSASAWDRWFGEGHTLDLSDGGKFSNADGNRATVKKANPGKTLRMIWEDAELMVPTPVEIKFQPSGAKTTLIVTIDRLQTRAEADGYRRAWGAALDRLKAVILEA